MVAIRLPGELGRKAIPTSRSAVIVDILPRSQLNGKQDLLFLGGGWIVDRTFRVGLTRDFLKPDDTPGFGDIGLSLLDRAGIAWEYLAERAPELRPEQVRDYDALLLLGARVPSATLEGAER